MSIESDYRALLKKFKLTDLFASYEWMSLTSHTGGWSYFADELSFICYDSYKKGPFRIISTPHHTPYSPVERLERVVNHLDDSTAAVKKLHLPYSIESNSRSYPLDMRITYAIDLAKGLDILWSNLASNKRQAIKKHSKNYEIKDCTPVEFYNFHNSIHKEQQLKIQWDYSNFLKLSEHLRSLDSLLLKKVMVNDEIASAIYVVKNNNIAYYIFGATRPFYKKQESNSALLWSAIEHFHKIGCDEFNFKGSMIPGIAKYFSLMGGDRHEYYSYNKESKIVSLLRKVF